MVFTVDCQGLLGQHQKSDDPGGRVSAEPKAFPTITIYHNSDLSTYTPTLRNLVEDMI